MNWSWVILAGGIVFEVLGTVCMKLADGFTKLVPSILVFVFYGLSLAALVIVLEKMEVGFAYAIWASVGIVVITIISAIWFNEPMNVAKTISIVLIVAGIIGLELF